MERDFEAAAAPQVWRPQPPLEPSEWERGPPCRREPQLAAPHAPSERIDTATYGLMQSAPALSAGSPTWWWQRALAGAVLFAILALPVLPLLRVASAILLAAPFLAYAVLRLGAVMRLAAGTGAQRARPGRSTRARQNDASLHEPGLLEPGLREPGLLDAALADADLPTYSVLVPLYQEAAVVPDLIAALGALDYPRDRLEVLLIVEADDGETRRALAVAALPSEMRIVVVPAGRPRTKPRALNFAVLEASGRLVAVFDAEDEPEPTQLRQAAAMFATRAARGGPPLGCVQARLNIYNPDDSWLTRQFMIEYTSHFDHILPFLERRGLLVPLGGTSNHFPRAVLNQLGAWDPFNVTEDADLGVRIARAGLSVAMLNSTTFEEAPDRWPVWLGQRTRWLKGWMQTWAVHMREPIALWRELGPRRFLWFQAILGGSVVSALVHPWFYGVAIWEFVARDEPGVFGSALWWVTASNLAIGYGAAIALGAAAVRQRGHPELMADVLMLPVYWLAISVAAHCALIDLVRRPSVWVKTPHKARGHSRRPATPPELIASSRRSRGQGG